MCRTVESTSVAKSSFVKTLLVRETRLTTACRTARRTARALSMVPGNWRQQRRPVSPAEHYVSIPARVYGIARACTSYHSHQDGVEKMEQSARFDTKSDGHSTTSRDSGHDATAAITMARVLSGGLPLAVLATLASGVTVSLLRWATPALAVAIIVIALLVASWNLPRRGSLSCADGTCAVRQPTEPGSPTRGSAVAHLACGVPTRQFRSSSLSRRGHPARGVGEDRDVYLAVAGKTDIERIRPDHLIVPLESADSGGVRWWRTPVELSGPRAAPAEEL